MKEDPSPTSTPLSSSTSVAYRYFLDTSALVKRYHQEPGTDAVIALIENPNRPTLISDLAIIEFHSALAKKVRQKELSVDAFQQVREFFLKECQAGLYEIVLVEDKVKAKSVELLNEFAVDYGLRTLDALQLATAWLLAQSRGNVAFVTADPKLLKLTREKITGLQAIDPSEPTTEWPRN